MLVLISRRSAGYQVLEKPSGGDGDWIIGWREENERKMEMGILAFLSKISS